MCYRATVEILLHVKVLMKQNIGIAILSAWSWTFLDSVFFFFLDSVLTWSMCLFMLCQLNNYKSFFFFFLWLVSALGPTLNKEQFNTPCKLGLPFSVCVFSCNSWTWDRDLWNFLSTVHCKWFFFLCTLHSS